MLVGDELARSISDRGAHGTGCAADLARDVAGLLDVFSLLDTVQMAGRYDEDPAEVTRLYFTLSERFAVDPLLNEITGLRREPVGRAGPVGAAK